MIESNGAPSEVAQDSSFNGFLPGPLAIVPAIATGPLSGLRFAVKDNIDLKGTVTGIGNPFWSVAREATSVSATVVERLLSAGATAVGKTVMDEFAFSLIGDNRHYGAPANPVCPGKFTGGSSSGSAAAVAGGHVDFALGTDTAGSIRLPASNCGLIGFRPGWDAIDTTGILPLAPCFDVPGWMASSPDVARRVCEVLLPAMEIARPITSYARLTPAFGRLEPALAGLVKHAMKRIPLECAGDADQLSDWPWSIDEVSEAFRVIQSEQAWRCCADWAQSLPIESIDAGIYQRIIAGRGIAPGQLAAANAVRDRVRDWLSTLAETYGVLAMPTVTQPGLSRSASPSERDAYRSEVLKLTCLASMAGLPEISLPLVQASDMRLGISLIFPPGGDRHVISILDALSL